MDIDMNTYIIQHLMKSLTLNCIYGFQIFYTAQWCNASTWYVVDLSFSNKNTFDVNITINNNVLSWSLRNMLPHAVGVC